MSLDLRHVVHNDVGTPKPEIKIRIENLEKREMLGPAAVADFTLTEEQSVYFVLREMPEDANRTREWIDKESAQDRPETLGVSIEQFREAAHLLRPANNPILSVKLVQDMINDTNEFWNRWIAKCKYRGRWREAVRRSALTLYVEMRSCEYCGLMAAKCSCSRRPARSWPRPRSRCQSTLAECATGERINTY